MLLFHWFTPSITLLSANCLCTLFVCVCVLVVWHSSKRFSPYASIAIQLPVTTTLVFFLWSMTACGCCYCYSSSPPILKACFLIRGLWQYKHWQHHGEPMRENYILYFVSQRDIEENNHSSKMWGICTAEGLMRWILSSLMPAKLSPPITGTKMAPRSGTAVKSRLTSWNRKAFPSMIGCN